MRSLSVSGSGHVGLVSCESAVGWNFLTPVERDLLRSVLLDIDHAGALRMPAGVHGAVSVGELSGLSDDALIARFNEYVDLLLGADWLLCIYDVCRPEVRELLSDAPMRDARYWRMRHGTPMADAGVERAARALLHAGLHKPLGEACAQLDEPVERMLVRVVLGERCDPESEIMSAGVRVLRESWTDLVRFLDVRSVGCGQVIDGPYAVSCPAVPYMCGGSVDIAEEDRRTPRVGALPSASDAQDVDQRVVVPALEPGGALVGSVAHEQPEGVIPRIVDSTTLAYEEFGIPDAAVGGEGRREQHLELCGWHVLVLISPEESGLAVLGENRACGFRQYVQLHVSILSRRVCGEASGVLCLDPLFLLWRDCGAGWILAGAVRSSMLDDCDSSGMEGARFLPRLSRYAVLVHVADHVFDARGWGVSDVEFPLQELVRVDVHPSYGCFGCEGVHAVGQWFGVVEVVLGVRFGHPPRVHRAVRGHGLENHHGYILPRHVRANDRGNSGKSPDYLLWRGCIAGLILAGAVASSLHPTSARRRVWGGARFLPRSSRYAVLAHAAGHVCGRVHSGVIPVARTHVLATGITVAPYSRLVSMLQAWMRAGLRVIVSPSPPVTSTVSPVRAPAASSSCNDSGSVSSARGLLRCGSHVMSSMLMVVSFPATFVASDRWNLVGSDYFAVVGSRDRSYPCRFRASSPVRRLALVGQEETRFLPRSSRYTVVAYAADHADGRGVSDVVEFPLQELVRVDIHLLYGCLGRESGHTVRQWFGVVEAVPGVRFGHLPRVNGAVRGHGFENDHNHNSFPATFMASIRGTVGISPGCFRCGGMAVPVVFLAGTVASSPASGDCYSSGVGEARFLPRFAWYAVPARAADHVCGVWLVSYWFV